MAEEPVELGYYTAVLRRHRWLVGGLAALGALVAVASMGSATYTATAEVVVRPLTTTAVGAAPEPDRVINTNTEQQIARSTAVAALAAERLDADDPKALLDHLTVAVPTESQVLAFRYSSADPDDAREGAQAFAEAYLDFRGTDARELVEERKAALQAEIDSLTAQLVEANTVINQAQNGDSDSPDDRALAEAQSRREFLLSALSVRNTALGELDELRVDPGEVIAPAADAQETGQSRVLLLLLGAGAGGVLGAVAAFVVDRARGRVNVAADLHEELGVPVLATVPAVARPSQVMVTHTEPRTAAAHAYRRLAVALSLGQEEPARSVLVVGATTTDPATPVALNLAIALIQQGRRVLLISADRHDPRIDRCFDLVGEPGLDEYLARRGTTEPREVLRGLLVLPAGSGSAYPVHNVPPREAVASVIERGQRIADIVVIDAPPALDYPDAEVMAPLVDAVIAVAAAERTSRRDAADLRERLVLASAPLRGAVLLRRPTLRDRLHVLVRDRQAVVPDGTDLGAADPPAPTRSRPQRAADLVESTAVKERISNLLRQRGVDPAAPGANGKVHDDDTPEAQRQVGS
jgi:Mrp family chromosome partitioning ATPase